VTVHRLADHTYTPEIQPLTRSRHGNHDLERRQSGGDEARKQAQAPTRDFRNRGLGAAQQGRTAEVALTVAVTGPTGEIGISAVTALEREPAVDTIVGMARRPFDPSSRCWVKTTYQQGDILDRDAVDALVAQADVVIHLAFIIMGSREESARVNLQGTPNVFEATVIRERPRRLVYTSSVATYG
jgi:UDP-glucose 4-epimerase